MPQVRLLHVGTEYLYYTTFHEFKDTHHIAHICIILTVNYVKCESCLYKAMSIKPHYTIFFVFGVYTLYNEVISITN